MRDSSEQTFRVLRAQTGDRQALDDLLRSVQVPLYRYVWGLVGDQSLAEDVLQDVLVLICRKLRWLRDPALFRPWAYRIASRRALRVLRRERRRAGKSLEELGTEPAAPPPRLEPELAASLPSLLAAASPASRAVLGLHYVEDMSIQETASVLGISVGTVKSRLSYGLAAVRRAYGPPDGARADGVAPNRKPTNGRFPGGRHETPRE